MTNEIPTPRTDAHFLRRLQEKGTVDKRDERFARLLERELNVATEALDYITVTDFDDLKVSRTGMYRAALSAKQRIEAMRRAYEEGK